MITCDHIILPAPPEWIYEGRYYSYWENLQLLWRVGLPTTKHAFESAAGQKLLNARPGSMQFDLVISEQFHQEAMLLFAHKFNAPLVTISEYMGIGLWIVWTVWLIRLSDKPGRESPH